MTVLLYTYFYNISLNALRPTFFNIYNLHSPNIGKIRVKVGPKTNYFSYFMSSCTNRIEVFNNFFSLICSQPRGKQNRARDFLVFKYFLNNLLLTVFIQTSSNYYNKKWMTHYLKNGGHDFLQQLVRNVWAKFKVDRLSRFGTGARRALTTQKRFPCENPLTMKTATSNSL